MAENLENLRQEINNLKNELISLGRNSLVKVIDSNQITNIKEAKDTIKDLRTILNDVTDSFSSNATILQSITNELRNQRDVINKTNSSANKLQSITTKLLDRREQIYSLSVKDLKKLEEESNIAFASLRRQLKFLEEKGKLSEREKIVKRELTGLLSKELNLQDDIANTIKSSIREQKAIEDVLGPKGTLLKGLKEIPFAGKIASDVFGDIQEAGEKLFQKTISDIKSSGEGLGKDLLDAKVKIEKIRDIGPKTEESERQFLQDRDEYSKSFTETNEEIEIYKKLIEEAQKDLERVEKEAFGKKIEDLTEAEKSERERLKASISSGQFEIQNLKKKKAEEREVFKEKEKNYKASLTYEEDLKKAQEERDKISLEIIKKAKEQVNFSAVLEKKIKDLTESEQERSLFILEQQKRFNTFIEGSLIKGFFSLNDGIIQLQKNLALSRTEALGLRTEFAIFSATQNDVIINTQDLLKVQGQFNEALGLQGKISIENAGAQLRLVDGLGISIESANQLRLASEALGTNLREQTLQQYEIVNAVSQQFGVQLDNKQVLEEVGKAGAYALVQFGGSVEALTEAVAQAKALGLELSDVNAIAGKLIEFESSIRSELEAELLLGRNINLERARFAALNNDQKTLMEEINREMGDFTDFQNLNRIQQEAFASSLGLSVDKLSDMLLLDQYREKSQRQITAEAGEEIANRVETLKTQEAFNKLILKVQQTIVDLVSGPLAGFGKLLEFAAENAGLVALTVGAIAGLSFAKTIGNLAVMIGQLGILTAEAVTFNSALTFGLGAAAIGAGIALALGYYAKAKDELTKDVGDLAIKATGETMISTKEGGIFKPSDRDQIAVGPNVIDSLMTPNQIVNVTTPQQQVIVDSNEALLKEIQGLRADNKRLMNRPVEAEISVRNFERVKRKQTSYI